MDPSNGRVNARPNGPGDRSDSDSLTTENNYIEELKNQRQWFEIALASIGDGVITADMQGLVTFLNPVAESLTGWTNREAVGQPLEKVFCIVNEDSHAQVENPALLAMQEGVVFGLANHTLLIARDGKEISIDDSGAPIKTDKGEFLGAVLVFRDITERRRAEEARALLAGIVDCSEDAIVSKKLDGTISSWNAAAERMFEYTSAEAIGQSITMIIPADRLDEEKLILSRLRRGERIDPFETVRIAKSGRRVHISLTVSPVRNRHDEIIGASKIARDISDRIRADEERRRLLASERAMRQQAEAASRAKDEFVAMISHEIRSPLNAILGWAQMLRQGSLDQDSRKRALETIERNARVQVQLLGDLMDISRGITGKLKIDAQPVEITTSLEAAIETIRPAAEAKAIIIDVHHGPTGSLVTGDADRLQQVFWNLLSNAVKFTPKHGHIKAKIERINSHLEVSISDSGIGITADFLPHVFDRFAQADTSTARKYGGLGLGLAIVRHLVELHGGSVRADSAGQGQGATFTVTLPVRAVRERAIDFDLSEPASMDVLADKFSFAGLRVMIVDDEIETRELLSAMLTARGAEARACGSAAEALAVIDEWKPSILVSDIGMPEEDGYTFIKQVRMLASSQRTVPAIALTAYARTEDRMRALSAGFQMHVPKPVEAMELLMVIASLADRHAMTA